jgi:hypothetical protein
MRSKRGPGIDATILGTAALFALAAGGTAQVTQRFESVSPPAVAAGGAEAFVGIWLSADDAVRLDVSRDGTYARSIVGRRATASGTYSTAGATLLLQDESGIKTIVTRSADWLEMAGYHLYKI